MNPQHHTPTPAPDRLLRLREVMERTALSRTAVYDLMEQGRFPRPVRLTKRCVAWPESLVNVWIHEKVREARRA